MKISKVLRREILKWKFLQNVSAEFSIRKVKMFRILEYRIVIRNLPSEINSIPTLSSADNFLVPTQNVIDSVAYNFEKIETCEFKEIKISIHPIFKREILKIAVFKKGVSIYASKSKAKTILNMIEINHGSHLPLKAFSATQPLLEFSKTPIYLFSTKHSPEGTIICLANPLYFPNKSIHFEKLSPRLDAFFFIY